MKSQKERLLKHLKIAPITPLEAFKYLRCLRLGARIKELRDSGYKIRTDMIEVINRHGEQKRVAQYTLEDKS